MLPRFFFFNDTATTEIYTLSLHDALPIFLEVAVDGAVLDHPDLAVALDDLCLDLADLLVDERGRVNRRRDQGDRKSTRLNSSHDQISYAVFCLKKKNKACGITCCDSHECH